MHSRISNLIIILLVAILVCSGIAIFFLQEENKQLHSSLKQLEKDSLETIKRLNGTIHKLQEENQELYAKLEKVNQSYHRLRKEYRELNESYNELGEAYTSQQSELNKAITSINMYEKELQNSMEWFKANSNPDSLPADVREKLDENCIEDEKIKLGCLYLVNDQLGYEYKRDIKTDGQEDKLQSLEDFVQNEGGDCEDYALFYKAELNYLLQKVERATLESYKQGDERLYLDFDEDWYIENAEQVHFEGRFNPVVVCGRMYDLNTETRNGHCVIALTKERVQSTQGLSVLKGAKMIEPQDGSLYGTIGEDIVLGNRDAESFISVVITNNDLFLYSSRGEWMSYSLFKERLKNLQQNITG